MNRNTRSAHDAHEGLKSAIFVDQGPTIQRDAKVEPLPQPKRKRKVDPHHTAVPIRSWSIPATTVLKGIGWLVAAVVASPFVIDFVRWALS